MAYSSVAGKINIGDDSSIGHLNLPKPYSNEQVEQMIEDMDNITVIDLNQIDGAAQFVNHLLLKAVDCTSALQRIKFNDWSPSVTTLDDRLPGLLALKSHNTIKQLTVSRMSSTSRQTRQCLAMIVQEILTKSVAV